MPSTKFWYKYFSVFTAFINFTGGNSKKKYKNYYFVLQSIDYYNNTTWELNN